jgi:hypothetical protein
MPRGNRKVLIEQLEDLRSSQVLTYITGDRVPAGAQIGDDALRPIYDQLRSVGKVDQLDLFIYSRGGSLLRSARWPSPGPYSFRSERTVLPRCSLLERTRSSWAGTENLARSTR